MALANVNLKFGLNLNDFRSELQKVNKSVVDAGKKMTSMGKGLSVGLTAPLVAAAGAALALSVKVGQTADRLLDLEQITNMSTDSIQEWQYVANQAGVSSETMTAAMEGLTRKLFDVTGLGNDATKTLEKIGIATKDASGNFLGGEEIMDSLIAKLGSMDSIVERNAIGAKLFGGAWKDIAPILSFGADGIANLRQEAHDLGGVMSKESLEAANAFRMSVDSLQYTFEGLTNQLAAKLAPLMNDTIIPIIQNTILPLFRKFTEYVGGLITSFQNLDPSLRSMILGFTAFAAGVGPAMVALGGLLQILPLIGVGFTALMGPIGTTVTALGIAAAFIITNFDEVKFAVKTTILELISFAQTAVKVVDTLTGVFPGFKATTTGAFYALQMAGESMTKSIVSDLGKKGTEAVDGLGESIKQMGLNAEQSFVSMTKLTSVGIKRTNDEGIGTLDRGTPEADLKLPETMRGVAQELPQQTSAIVGILESFNSQVNDLIGGSISGAFMSLGNAIGQAMGSGANVLAAAGKAILSTLGGFLGQLGKMMIEYGTMAIVKAKLDASLAVPGAGFVTGPLAIAAGLALVALSSAIGSFGSGKGGGGAGGGGPLGPADSVSGKRAMGGTVQMNQPYLVGERGPEIFTPSTFGNITPNGGMAGGSMKIHVTGRLVGSGDQLVGVIDDYNYSIGRST